MTTARHRPLAPIPALAHVAPLRPLVVCPPEFFAGGSLAPARGPGEVVVGGETKQRRGPQGQGNNNYLPKCGRRDRGAHVLYRTPR